MTIINTSPDRIIQLGYEGEDNVTKIIFRYDSEWLSYGEGVFIVRVRRHGEHTAYNAPLVMDDRENTTLLMTVTNVELSVKGAGEMQVVYSGADFVKKSPIYSYNVSRAVDEAVNQPAQDVYTQIIESLSDLQMDVQGLSDAVEDIGDISLLTTTAKSDLVSAINEVNAKGSVVTVSGMTPTITALSGVRYVCGQVETLDFTPCTTGICDVVFTSGSTPTVVTLPDTVKFPDGAFTAEANKTYEINILDGVYGVVMAWT